MGDTTVVLVADAVATEWALRALGASDDAVIYVDRAVREPGVVAIGSDTHHLDRPAVMVFRDEMPGANWMHPCTYALVDADTGEPMLTVAADRPPTFGRLDSTWLVAADPTGRAFLAPPTTPEGDS